MKCISFIALLLIVIGALNWGLIGFFGFNFVAWIFGGDQGFLARLVYALVGLSGVWGISFLGKCKALCGSCDKGGN